VKFYSKGLKDLRFGIFVLELEMAGISETLEVEAFMNERIARAVDYSSAYDNLERSLAGYELVGHVSVFPDFTNTSSLPTGVTATVMGDRAINPNLIGRDIGCGYNFFSVDLNPSRFVKSGEASRRRVSRIVGAIDEALLNGGKYSLGGGNHFADMFVPEEIYDEKFCEKFGITPNRVYFLVHSGSRKPGFDTYLSLLIKFGNVEDSEKFNAEYIKRFNGARNFARENRAALQDMIVEAVRRVSNDDVKVRQIIDLPHNDIEVHGSGEDTLYKLKKGTQTLKKGGIAVIAGTAVHPTYIVKGLHGVSWTQNTINHGSGRVATRRRAADMMKRANGKNPYDGVVTNVTPKENAEENPRAYKDVEDVIDSIEKFGLAKRVAKLRPVGVVVKRKDLKKKRGKDFRRRNDKRQHWI